MKTLPLVLLLAALPASAGIAIAQEAAPVAAPEASAPVDKTPETDRLRLEFNDAYRMITAFYPNQSQARLKLFAASRYDGEIAKNRETFQIEVSGSGVADRIRLDADDTVSIDRIIAILERFKSESEKSGKLKAAMTKRKTDADAALSREETLLVELKAAVTSDAAAIAAAEARIADLKVGVAMADEIASMPKISGVIGKARINTIHPEYEFVASFEPEKELFTLTAGYSFRIGAKDVKFYIDLLKRTQEFKNRLLENEVKNRRVRSEIESILAAKED